MRLILSVALLLLIGFAARAQNLEGYIAEAEAVIQRLRGVMMSELERAADLAPAEAVALCRHLAPEIKRQIEKESGWRVRRVALRVRNPQNRANDEERGILLGFETRSAAGQSVELLRTRRIVDLEGRRQVLVVQAIPTFNSCLVCHGSDLDPDVDRAVRGLYPEDETTGYAVGDMRGTFALYKPLNKREEPGVDSLIQPPRPLLERLGYRPRKREGAVGDAGAGVATFQHRCQRCHAPDDLARHLFMAEPRAAERDICLFLETHGLTGEAGACDIVAFLQDLALFLAESRQ